MNYKTKSYETKKKLAKALKKLMQKKNFKNISIVDITILAKVNRKTFYYHFKTIPDLLKWMLECETVEIAQSFDLLNNFDDAFQFSINYIDENKAILISAYDNLGRDEMRKFFINDFIDIIEISVKKCEDDLGIQVSDDFRRYLCDFYSEGIASKIVERLKDENSFTMEQFSNYFKIIFSDSLPYILKKSNDKA